MRSSQRPTGRDKTALSRRVWRCELGITISLQRGVYSRNEKLSDVSAEVGLRVVGNAAAAFDLQLALASVHELEVASKCPLQLRDVALLVLDVVLETLRQQAKLQRLQLHSHTHTHTHTHQKRINHSANR